MPFNKGRTKTGGRQRGTPNKFTGTFREAVQVVYEGLGGHTAFLRWARENPDDFYKIAARLIPAETEESDSEGSVTIVVQQFTPPPIHKAKSLESTHSARPVQELH